jgi:hypothetical protein
MNSLELDREKISHCRNKLMESYFGSSIVQNATDAIDYDESIHRNLDFLKFGSWHYIPRNWFTDRSIYPDLVFMDIGRGIALGEEKHIVETISANDKVKRIAVESINYSNIVEAASDLVSEVQRSFLPLQLILFAPIQYFVPMYTDWRREHRFEMRPSELIVDGFRFKLFWSSKYIDYADFIVSEKSLCRWIAKPNVVRRLEVEIRESEKPGEMELKAQTVFNFTIRDPEKIRVLRSTQPLQET